MKAVYSKHFYTLEEIKKKAVLAAATKCLRVMIMDMELMNSCSLNNLKYSRNEHPLTCKSAIEFDTT